MEIARKILPAELSSRLQSGSALLERQRDGRRAERISFALPAVDRLLQGGLPRGVLAELSGPRSSGRQALALTALAALTQSGESAALVDVGNQLDPQQAAAFGVELPRLLWVRPPAAQALAVTEAILSAGFALCVLDTNDGLRRSRALLDHAFRRLAHTARVHESTLLVVSTWPLCGTAAHVVLAAEQARGSWEHGLLQGLALRLTVREWRVPGKAEAGGRSEPLLLLHPQSVAAKGKRPRANTQPVQPAQPIQPARSVPLEPLPRVAWERGKRVAQA